MFFIQFRSELCAKAKRRQSTSNSTCLSLFNVVWKTRSLLRLGTSAYTAFAIFNDSSEDDKAIGPLDHFFVLVLLFIPHVNFFFRLTVKVEMQHLGFDAAFWTQRPEPGETPLDWQVIPKPVFGFNLH